MATTHGAAADAEMANMEGESSGARSTSTKTFKDAKSAIAHAKKLLDEGEISKADFARIEKKMVAEDQEGHLRAWLHKTYGKARD
ncbi:hypothetical protein [Tardiphaga sp. vice278]|uniref:hypothetical protein n=1 Tax=Tardiphaga sp. vice278 TaxID=2592815 RepID=UPI0011629BA1|nr:hypothetical protein [Tardiphaga sp. vice278]QDM15174.1 hypothetical protein FNL53_03755 [Tardiphaga sp. vice278]